MSLTTLLTLLNNVRRQYAFITDYTFATVYIAVTTTTSIAVFTPATTFTYAAVFTDSTVVRKRPSKENKTGRCQNKKVVKEILRRSDVWWRCWDREEETKVYTSSSDSVKDVQK